MNGRDLTDDYEISARIARGSKSVVHRCFYKKTGAEKAIKIIRRSNVSIDYWKGKLTEM